MKFNVFHNTFLLILENSFPLVYKKKKNTSKCITRGIRTFCNYKRAQYILVKKSNDERLKLYYTRYCRILMNIVTCTTKRCQATTQLAERSNCF
jgi:hypothetical protein